MMKYHHMTGSSRLQPEGSSRYRIARCLYECLRLSDGQAASGARKAVRIRMLISLFPRVGNLMQVLRSA